MLGGGGGMAVGNHHAIGGGQEEGLPRLPPINDVVVCLEDTTLMGTTIDELYDAYLMPR